MHNFHISHLHPSHHPAPRSPDQIIPFYIPYSSFALNLIPTMIARSQKLLRLMSSSNAVEMSSDDVAVTTSRLKIHITSASGASGSL